MAPRGFRLYWRWKSRGRVGRPQVEHEHRALARALLARALLLLGYPDQALHEARASLEEAQVTGYKFSICEALRLGVCSVALLTGDLKAAESAVATLVLGDRVQLQQVMLNLIMNSIEAMSAVMDRPRVLEISAEPVDGNSLLVAVEDTGPGLDPAIASRVFDAFFTTKANGMGMGLSICRSIVEAHGGRLWVSHRSPHGAAFRFTLPHLVSTSAAMKQ